MTPVSQTLLPKVPWHRRAVVRRSILAAFLLSTFLIVGAATGLAEKISDKFVLYVHVARLYPKAPDKKLSMPVKDVTKNEITNTWHAARDGHLHEGQDIFAPRGTPVISATTGYVVKIGEDNLGGQTVSVIGDGGRKYYYAHLDSYAPRIRKGDYVTRRTVLGYVGTTGNAAGTPPHLHFGMYTAGGALDPLPLLTDRSQERKPVAPKTKKEQTKKRR